MELRVLVSAMARARTTAAVFTATVAPAPPTVLAPAALITGNAAKSRTTFYRYCVQIPWIPTIVKELRAINKKRVRN